MQKCARIGGVWFNYRQVVCYICALTSAGYCFSLRLQRVVESHKSLFDDDNCLLIGCPTSTFVLCSLFSIISIRAVYKNIFQTLNVSSSNPTMASPYTLNKTQILNNGYKAVYFSNSSCRPSTHFPVSRPVLLLTCWLC